MTGTLSRGLGFVRRLLGSSRLATAIMLSWMLLLLVWVLPFILYGVPGERVRAIVEGEPFFRMVYAALLVSTALCVLPRTAGVIRRARALPGPSSAPRIASGGIALPGEYAEDRARRALDAAGFGPLAAGEGWTWGVRRRWGVLGTLLFHASFFLVATAAGVALLGHAAFTGTLVLTEGERLSVQPADYVDVQGTDAPRMQLALDSLTPRFFDDKLLFTKLEGVLETGGTKRTVAVGRPWHRDGATTVALTDFGWSLQVSGRDASGPLTPTVYDLKVFPSGTPDEFELGLGEATYRVEVRVWGDYVDRSGTPGSASFNADDPRVEASAWRVGTNGEEKLVAADRILPIGGSLAVPDGTVRFDALLSHGVFRVTRQPWQPWMLAALLAALAGTALRLAAPRVEAVLRRAEDGRPTLHLQADVYGRDERSLRRITVEWDEEA